MAAEGRLDAEWEANSYDDDGLNVHGTVHPLVSDSRFATCSAPWSWRLANPPPLGIGSSRFSNRTESAALVEPMRSIDGWFDEIEAGLLIRVVERALGALPPPHAIVEVGSYCGRSTVAMAGAVRALAAKATVYSIDPHLGDVGAIDSAAGQIATAPTLERFVANIRRFGLEDVIVPIQARSTDVLWHKPITLMLVDGLHDYLNVSRDVAHFERWLVGGGYLLFHDHSDDFPGVGAVVRQLLASHHYVARDQCGSLLVLQKIGQADGDGQAGLFDPAGEAGSARMQLEVRDQTIHALRVRVTANEQQIQTLSGELVRSGRELAERDAAIVDLTAAAAGLDAWVQALLHSKSWRLTAPLRALQRFIRVGLTGHVIPVRGCAWAGGREQPTVFLADTVWQSIHHDLAALEQHRPRAECGHDPPIVADDQNSVTGSVQRSIPFFTTQPKPGIANGKNLVKNQDLTNGVKGYRIRETRGHAARVVLQFQIRERFEFGKRENRVHAGANLGECQSHDGANHVHVVYGVELGVPAEAQLENRRNRRTADDTPEVGLVNPGDDLQQSRFARSVATHESNTFTRLQLESDVVQDSKVAESPRPKERQCMLAHRVATDVRYAESLCER